MRHRAVLEKTEVSAAPECRHHWLIESPNGATSRGTCRLCGEHREFRNSASDALWEWEGITSREEGPLASYSVRGGGPGEDGEPS
jgi:hypothetical protein